MSKLLDEALEEMIEGEGIDIEELEKVARIESLKLLVTNAMELAEEDMDKATSYVDNTVLTFTANALKNGGMSDWIPFIIDAILITPDRAVQGLLRNAANIAMKGIIIELDSDVPVTPLTDLYDHMQEHIDKLVEEKGVAGVKDLLTKVRK